MKFSMPLTRRNLLVGSVSLVASGFVRGLGQDQSRATSTAVLDSSQVALPLTHAAHTLFHQIGADSWKELNQRLRTVNADIQTHGLRHIPNIEGTFLTGYPYNEFYDWDLYFENLYLSYFGVSQYCFTNLKEFLNREQPDGYVTVA